MKHKTALLSTAALLGTAALLAGCVADPVPVDSRCPPAASFVSVSPVLERHCGTLDCHGALSRPFRVYGSTGMRLIEDAGVVTDAAEAVQAGAIPNGRPTSEAEIAATRSSVCGLEPEAMADLAEGVVTADDLMMLRKPVGGERHKGGAIFAPDEAAARCIRSWLEGRVDEASCAASAM